MTHTSVELQEFFRTQGIRFGRCLEPTMQCTETAIRAHSIQNRQTISLLEQDNHVVAWQPRFSQAGPEITLKRVGRNDASTFAGFCNRHDTQLFAALDTKPLDPTDRQQLFLLAYRGITCELHAIMTGVVQVQSMHISRVERGVERGDAASPAWATWRYRYKYYDEPILSQSLGTIEHEVVEFDNQPAFLAASSFFTLKDVPVGQELVGVAINVLPVSASKTVAVFSYAGANQGVARSALDRILRSTGDTQKYELSKLIVSRISNVLLSPRHVDQWGATKVGKITQAFVQSLYSQRDVDDDVELMLF